MIARLSVHVKRKLATRRMSKHLPKGYVQLYARDGQGCEAHCANCPLAKTCAIGSPTRVWVLVEKGTSSDVKKPQT